LRKLAPFARLSLGKCHHRPGNNPAHRLIMALPLGIGGDFKIMRFKLKAAVEIEPESNIIHFTHQVLPGAPVGYVKLLIYIS
jgi:hypothetical protein